MSVVPAPSPIDETDHRQRGVARALAAGVSTRNFVAEEREAVEVLLEALKRGAEVVEPEDLLGTKEVAELLGVDRTTVSRWRSAGYMPAPFRELATGPIWLRQHIDPFAEQHRQVADAAGRRPRGTA